MTRTGWAVITILTLWGAARGVEEAFQVWVRRAVRR